MFCLSKMSKLLSVKNQSAGVEGWKPGDLSQIPTHKEREERRPLLRSEMKLSSLSLAAAAALVALGAAPSGCSALVLAARPLVFEAEGVRGVGASDCHSLKAEDACLKGHCYWCKSAAVPSSCYSEEEASQLPPAVFQCDKAPPVASWELTEVSSRH